MGKTVLLRCNQCGRESTVEWGKEFYVDSQGREHYFGNLEAISEEARKRGISGFWVDKVCKNCGEVIRESRYLEDIVDEHELAWMNFPKVDIVEKCTKCGSRDVMTLYELIIGEDKKVPCSCCRDGKMKVEAIYE
ncbi:MAG: hypothetical protein N2594_03820 [Clostridiales bacterium]|nr:hypothetical protein [Clostridiales bacterium]